MKINDAKNAFKVGDFLLRKDKSPNKIKIKYLGKIKSLQNSLIENGFIFEILNNEWNLTLAG